MVTVLASPSCMSCWLYEPDWSLQPSQVLQGWSPSLPPTSPIPHPPLAPGLPDSRWPQGSGSPSLTVLLAPDLDPVSLPKTVFPRASAYFQKTDPLPARTHSGAPVEPVPRRDVCVSRSSPCLVTPGPAVTRGRQLPIIPVVCSWLRGLEAGGGQTMW